MSTRGIIGALALAGCSLTLTSPISGEVIGGADFSRGGDVILIGQHDRIGDPIVIDASSIDRDTIEVRRSLPRDGQRRRRAKGPQAKPRKRSNRLHVSKRTRRKHRRAA